MTPYYQSDVATIYCGEAFDVLHELSGFGAVVTDPPYSSGGQYRGDRTASTVSKYVDKRTIEYRPDFAGDNRDQRSFAAWCALWLTAARHACEPGAPVISFIDWRQLPTLTDAIQAAGWTWRGLATWWKPGIRMQKGRFSHSAEYLVYGTNGPAAQGAESVQNVHRCNVDRNREHIAQKPEDVMRWALGPVPAGVRVLDPFMGSGSTLVAAASTGRTATGIDVDERYCEIAARRLDAIAADPEAPATLTALESTPW